MMKPKKEDVVLRALKLQMESFSALKLSRLESFRALKIQIVSYWPHEPLVCKENLENFRFLKLSELESFRAKACILAKRF